MHVIVVRRDLRRFQHLHPVQGADGAWTTPLTLPDAGVYRAFADFRRGGDAAHARHRPLRRPATSRRATLPAASHDRHRRRLRGHAPRASPASSRFFVRRGGKLVTDLQPYLGARGHLVALRAGDLAYEHVHPDAGPPPEIAFHVAASEPGTYRLFLQFRHDGRVHTAAFTTRSSSREHRAAPSTSTCRSAA